MGNCGNLNRLALEIKTTTQSKTKQNKTKHPTKRSNAVSPSPAYREKTVISRRTKRQHFAGSRNDGNVEKEGGSSRQIYVGLAPSRQQKQQTTHIHTFTSANSLHVSTHTTAHYTLSNAVTATY